MINKNIKIYKNLLEVEITDFDKKRETLYWEWTIAEFWYKYKSMKAISFPIHWGRVIEVNRIQWWDQAKWNDSTLQQKIISLDKMHQENIKLLVKKYKTDFRKYPSEERINNVINLIVFPEKEKEIEYKKEKESEDIREKKINRVNYYNSLSEDKKKNIIDNAWSKVFTINANYKENKHNIKAKILFNKYKNEILDNLIK